MPPQKITVNSRKFDQSIRRSWQCDLVKQDGSALEFVGIFDEAISHPDLGEIRAGTISYEYYWLDRWYNIFHFHEPDGAFRNYYCNITMPPTFQSGVLDYVDLDIDVLVRLGADYEVIDQAEFDENALKYAYPESVKSNAAAALTELINLIENGELPAG